MRTYRQVAHRLAPALLAAMLMGTTAAAQDARHRTTIALGVAVPRGALDETARPGVHAQVAYDLGRMDTPLGFRVDGFASQLGGEFAAAAGAPRERFPTERIFALTGNAIYRGHVGAWVPYLIAGAGPYVQDGYIAQVNLGAKAGAGLEFPLLGTRMVLEAQYHTALTRNGPRRLQLVPVSLGVRF